MITVATVDNLSGAVWRLLPPPIHTHLHFASPAAIYEALRQGACDAGLLPTARLGELSHRFVPLENYGIACTGAVRSVVLFSRVPVSQLIVEQHPIHVTRKSETSRQLLHVLARQTYGQDPAVTFRAEAAHARLLIGDEAMAEAQRNPDWIATDMGAWWHRRTGLPFVFARWVVRRDLPSHARAALRSWVSDCVIAAEEMGSDALCEHAPALDATAAKLYYQGLHYRLGSEDLLGLQRFMEIQGEAAPCQQIA